MKLFLSLLFSLTATTLFAADGALSNYLGTTITASISGGGSPHTNSVIAYGDANATNAVFVGPGGEVLSNAVGSVTISGGSQTNTGNIQTATLNTTGASTFGGNITMSGTASIFAPNSSQTISGNAAVLKNAFSWGGGGIYYLAMGVVNNDTTGIGFSTGQANGTLQPVLLVSTNKTVTVTNSTAASSYGTMVSGGYASYKNNAAAPTSISVTASEFLYTNTQPVNIQVFIDAAGATTTVKMNGTQIFASLVAGDHTVILQPGDWIGLTYSVGTPTMRYREF